MAGWAGKVRWWRFLHITLLHMGGTKYNYAIRRSLAEVGPVECRLLRRTNDLGRDLKNGCHGRFGLE
jgi:hypothetical protein